MEVERKAGTSMTGSTLTQLFSQNFCDACNDYLEMGIINRLFKVNLSQRLSIPDQKVGREGSSQGSLSKKSN